MLLQNFLKKNVNTLSFLRLTVVSFALVAISSATLAAPSARKRVSQELHPMHVSLTTIDYNPQARSLEITCKIFADDLEDAIKKTSGAQLYLGSQKENPAFATAKIEEYLRRHFRVEFVDAPPLAEWTFVGRELEGDAMWCYLECAGVALPSAHPRVKVAQTVLLDLYDDQTNVVNVSLNGERRSALIRKAKHSEILDF